MTKVIETVPVKPAVLTTREAAQYLKISLPTLHRRVREGEIPYFRIGRALRFRVEDLDAFVAALVTRKWKNYKKKA
jgi:excisionase family DNA binding protein